MPVWPAQPKRLGQAPNAASGRRLSREPLHPHVKGLGALCNPPHGLNSPLWPLAASGFKQTGLIRNVNKVIIPRFRVIMPVAYNGFHLPAEASVSGRVGRENIPFGAHCLSRLAELCDKVGELAPQKGFLKGTSP